MKKLSECEKGYRRWISPTNKSKPYKPIVKPQCPICGYTKEDAQIHMDHHLCKGTIPGARRKRNPLNIFSDAHLKLKRKYGTPAEFAVASYKYVPDFISMDEAAEAIKKYQKEWDEA